MYLKKCDICGSTKNLCEVGLLKLVKPSGEALRKQEITDVKVVCSNCLNYVDYYLDSIIYTLKRNYSAGTFMRIE